MIKRIIRSRKLKALVLGFLDPFFIKNRDKIIFVVKDRTFFSGNLRVVCEKYINNKHNKLYIYKDGKCQAEIKEEFERLGVTVLDSFSFISVHHILTSGVLILSHNPRDAHISKKFKRRKIINLWHGVAIKRIENLMPNIPFQKQKQLNNNAKLYDMLISSSRKDQQTNEKAFGVDRSIVKITGLPRYEILKDSYVLGTVLQDEFNHIADIKNGRKLVLYAPTFRESNGSAIGQINNNEWKVLELFAKENNFLFGIRPHPYDIEYLPKIVKKSKHFYLFLNEKFTEPNIVLKLTDVLIVDFTSIWIDYLLLERPIIGFAKDYKHYVENERGFVYDFNAIFPSLFVDDIDLLVEEIKQVSLIKEAVKYKNTTNILHEYNLTYEFSEEVYRKIERIRSNG